ncbi:hypothetical protein EQV97_14175 [Pseudomonas sp. TMW22090]|nr:hypothetical protein [Pseudomonas sp. TMW22090]
MAAWRWNHRLASQRLDDCIQLYIHIVSLNFRIFHSLSSCSGSARNLPDWSANGSKVLRWPAEQADTALIGSGQE